MTTSTASNQHEAFAREMIAAYRNGSLPEVFEPYFAWKTNRAPLISITDEQALGMTLTCTREKDEHPHLAAYLNRIAFELDALRRAGMVKLA